MSSKPEKQPSRLAKKPDVTELQYLMNSQACEPVVLEVLREMKRHQTKEPSWDVSHNFIKSLQIRDYAHDLPSIADKEKLKKEACKISAMCIRLIREL